MCVGMYIFINTTCIYNINTCIPIHSSEWNYEHPEWKFSVGLPARPHLILPARPHLILPARPHLIQDFHQHSALSFLPLLYC